MTGCNKILTVFIIKEAECFALWLEWSDWRLLCITGVTLASLWNPSSRQICFWICFLRFLSTLNTAEIFILIFIAGFIFSLPEISARLFIKHFKCNPTWTWNQRPVVTYFVLPGRRLKIFHNKSPALRNRLHVFNLLCCKNAFTLFCYVYNILFDISICST